MTAYLVNYLSVEDYGLWKFSVTLFSAAWLFQIGFNSVISREIPIAHVQKLEKNIGSLVSTVFYAYFTIGMIAMMVAYLYLYELIDIFNFYKNNQALSVFLVVFLSYGIWLPLSTYRSVMQGNRWFVASSNIESLSHVVFLLAILVVTNLHFSVIAITLCSAIRLLFGVIVNFIYSTRNSTVYYPRLKEFDFSIIKNNLLFGVNSTVFSLATFLLTFSSVWMAAILGNAQNITNISIAVQLSSVLTGLLSIMMVVIKPEISRLGAEKKQDDIEQVYLNSLRVVMMVSIPFAVFISLFSEQIFLFWLGRDTFHEISSYIFWFAGAQVCWLFIRISFFVVNALGQHKFISILATLTLLLSVVSSYLIVTYFGDVEQGLAIGLALPLLFSSVVVVPIYMVQKVKIQINYFYKIIVVRALVPCFLVSIFFFLVSIYYKENKELFFMLILSPVYYGVVIWLVGLDRTEKNKLINFVSKIY